MNTSMFKLVNRFALIILCVIGLIEFGLGIWTVLENRYKILAYNLADVGYIDLWILRYLSMCLFASAIITLVMCLILAWGLYSTHVFIFISSTMIALVVIAEFMIAMMAFTNKFQTRITIQEQLPKLVITYRQGNDERASRALDMLQSTFHCCGSDGRLSFQNNVPSSCNVYSVGCLTRAMSFLDSCMDVLAYILMFFSLIKLVIITYFYSFLCIYQRLKGYHHRYHPKKSKLMNESLPWRHSASFDSSSPDDMPKKIFAIANQDKITNNDNNYVEKRRIILNEYDSQSANKRVENAATILPAASLSLSLPMPISSKLSTPPYDQQVSRKLSSISERTEKTETDDSEPELLRIRQHNSKQKAIIAAANEKDKQPPPLPTKLPMIKSRKRIARDDDNDNDSGVERSSSEKSFDDQNISKANSDNTQPLIGTNTKPKSILNKPTGKTPPTLSFSNVFVTSISQSDIRQPTQNVELEKKPITSSPSSSSSLSDQLLLSDATIPKPILKKSNQQSSPSSDQDRIPPSYNDQMKISSIIHPKSYVKLSEPHILSNPPKMYVPYKAKENSLLRNAPKPAPRPSLQQVLKEKQGESLV
ncbi:unnamed protein product [Rotaria socialis]|uniref:Tetraspanin n=1 Tax=Rotaria socialis TaxID=392032 RepID=A0A820JTF8_9BILA|nr:unnamed protein product [Rotaria socialis]CAF4330201.1 unnamed protein product [Rotaria socialis]